MFAQLDFADIERAVVAFEPVLPGWRLFPVVGKVPGRGLAWPERASADVVERAAMAELDHDGWAVACGPSGLLVVDLDVHDDLDGVAAWCEFLDRHGVPQAEDNPGIVGTTPSGGRHLHYRAEPGIGNRVSVLPGVDIRAAGGYAVMAGPGRLLTIHEWTLPPIPDALREVLVPPEPVKPTRASYVPAHAVADALRTAADLVAAAEPGRRNDLLNWAAYKPGREAVRRGASPETVEAILVDAALECGLAEAEARATIRSGLGVSR